MYACVYVSVMALIPNGKFQNLKTVYEIVFLLAKIKIIKFFFNALISLLSDLLFVVILMFNANVMY